MRETLCDECDDVLFVKEREREIVWGGFGPLVWVRDLGGGSNEGLGYVTTEICV